MKHGNLHPRSIKKLFKALQKVNSFCFLCFLSHSDYSAVNGTNLARTYVGEELEEKVPGQTDDVGFENDTDHN